MTCGHVAHIRENDGEIQSLLEHLNEVGDLASDFARKIDAPEAGRVLGLLHDFGKFSQAFQNYLNSAQGRIRPDEDDYVDAKSAKGKIDHSSAGAQFIWARLGKYGGNGQGELVAQILALCIASHHSGLIDCLDSDNAHTFLKRMGKDDEKTHLTECLEQAEGDFLQRIDELVTKGLVKSVFDQVQRIVNFSGGASTYPSHTDAFTLGVYTRFLFSCLIDGDRLNSAEFEVPSRKELRLSQKKWLDWGVAVERCERKIAGFEQKRPIDVIRRNISDNCRQRAYDAQGIYSLTVPTGGGKTLASLRYALHHAKVHGLERIIYIIPYTSIIEQNARAIREVLEQEDDLHPWVLEHHSNLEPERQTWHSKLVSENWDAPIVLTTMVQFLETLFAGGTRSVRRMHQLANAVLIFDEIQTLPVNCVHLFCNAVNFLTNYAKTTTLLCTATQSLLDNLRFKDKGQLVMSPDYELVGNGEQVQTLFSDLTRVNISSLTRIGGWTSEEITELAMARLKEFGSCLVIVNTKNWAQQLYQSCEGQVEKEAIFHLSTSLYPFHRKEKLDEIKKRLSAGLPVVCISTQLIEAGVDISFGAVIRFLAGLDSIAQAAGRCNRHGEFQDANGKPIRGQVDIINPDSETIALLPDIAVGQKHTQRILDEVEESDLLSPKVMKRYFQYYFFERSDGMDFPVKDKSQPPEQTLFKLLGNNRLNTNSTDECSRPGKLRLMRQSFMEAGRLFKAIDAPTRSLVIRHGEGIHLVNELCRLAKDFEPHAYYHALKKAQQYSINVFPNTWDKLEMAGAIHETQQGEGIYFLDSEYYSNEFGVSTERPGDREVMLL